MGYWGTGIFQNDAALDWVLALESTPDLSLITETFAFIEEASIYEESWDGVDGLAAAEVVAAMNGLISPCLPEEARLWLQAHATPPGDELVAWARRVVRKIRRESLARQVWSSAGRLPDWERAVDDLLSRL